MPTEPQHTEVGEEGRPKANFCTKTGEKPRKRTGEERETTLPEPKYFVLAEGFSILLTLYHLFVIQWAIKIPWRAGGWEVALCGRN